MQNQQKLRRVLVAIELGDHEALVQRAQSLASPSGALVDLVHVLEPQLLAMTEGVSEDAVARALGRIGERLDKVAQGLKSSGCPCVATNLCGAVGVRLAEHIRATSPDIVVLGGTHDATPIVSGSVHEAVVREAGDLIRVVTVMRAGPASVSRPGP